MVVFSLDLARPFFWIFLLGAVLLVTPLTNARLRRGVLAMLNLGFASWIVGPLGALAVTVLCLLVFVGARLARPRNNTTVRLFLRILVISLMGGFMLFLFLVHKRSDYHIPFLSPSILGAARSILATIGFSYLALRSVELLRAGADDLLKDADALDAINYLVPFHMLTAGPIQSWEGFCEQPALPPPPNVEGTLRGLERIANGLMKKYVLARMMEVTLLTGFRAPWPYTLFEAQIFCLWVFLDFSAYSDIAVGAGILLGIPTPENFQNPLAARNIIQFWERWHISLSQFIRRNIFTPLQLHLMRHYEGRRPLLIASLAFAVAFLLCGLWHGINLRFLIWGAMHASALILCNLYRQWLSTRLGRNGLTRYLGRPVIKGLSTVLTFEFVAFSLAFIAHPALAFLERG